MNTKILFRHIGTGLVALISMLVVTAAQPSPQPSPTQPPTPQPKELTQQQTPSFHAAPSSAPEKHDLLTNQAKKLQKRIYRRTGAAPSVTSLKNALFHRQKLLKKTLIVQFETDDGTAIAPWIVKLQNYPTWVSFAWRFGMPQFRLREERIQSTLEQTIMPNLPSPTHAVILGFRNNGELIYANTSGTVRPGFVLKDTEQAVNAISQTLEQDKEEKIFLPLTKENGRIFYVRDNTVQTLERIASGKSSFFGSPWERIANIRKALTEHLDGVVIQSGETFSFNKMLGGPVTMGNGWLEALGIFANGEELRKTPGGGICQVSTTFFRAVARAGLPVLERRNHSLFISYYKKYGVGLDATIFPGTQDFVFKNDTPSLLLVQAYSEGTNAMIDLYGISDGRTVSLEGPYVVGNAPDDLRVHGRKLALNEIVWIQSIDYADRRTEQNIILSSYKDAIPQNVITRIARNEHNDMML